MTRKLGWMLVAILTLTAALDTGESLVRGKTGFGLGQTAEAVVGRPLTPVSVAGVARRTTRRCAEGVYTC